MLSRRLCAPSLPGICRARLPAPPPPPTPPPCPTRFSSVTAIRDLCPRQAGAESASSGDLPPCVSWDGLGCSASGSLISTKRADSRRFSAIPPPPRLPAVLPPLPGSCSAQRGARLAAHLLRPGESWVAQGPCRRGTGPGVPQLLPLGSPGPSPSCGDDHTVPGCSLRSQGALTASRRLVGSRDVL